VLSPKQKFFGVFPQLKNQKTLFFPPKTIIFFYSPFPPPPLLFFHLYAFPLRPAKFHNIFFIFHPTPNRQKKSRHNSKKNTTLPPLKRNTESIKPPTSYANKMYLLKTKTKKPARAAVLCFVFCIKMSIKN
ncbi:hypothetical protein, partial [Lacticaseibacillus casei]|uniref:hypothetical protein n=1 Tax=Lacticaseibacillus casei TaxID=1582 RepID=UPI002E35074A